MDLNPDAPTTDGIFTRGAFHQYLKEDSFSTNSNEHACAKTRGTELYKNNHRK